MRKRTPKTTLDYRRFYRDARGAVAAKSFTAEDLWRFLARAEARSDASIELFMRRPFQMLLATAIAFSITRNAVRDASFAGLSLSDLSGLVIVMPVVIAALYHDAVAALTAANFASDIVVACYEHLYKDDADKVGALLPPANFIDIEVRVAPTERGIAGWFLLHTSRIVRLTVTGGPVLLIVYVCRLAAKTATEPWVILLITTLTGLIVVRAYLLEWVTTFTPDFKWHGE